MVHPGIIVAGVFGTMLTGVVLYAILREEIHSLLESQIPTGFGHERPRRQRRYEEEENRDDSDFRQDQGRSSSYGGAYELRRRRQPNEDEEDETTRTDNDELLERLRKLEESERVNAAKEARLEEMERSLTQLQEKLERSMLEQEEMFESFRREQDSSASQHQLLHQSPEIFQNPFASNEPLIRDYSGDETQHNRRPSSSTSSQINPRTADAILRHNLSSNHQENVNPFADPSLLLENDSLSSPRSSHADDNFRDIFADADDRSVTVGHDDEHDWTEAEIGSMGSIDSDESWGSN